MKNTLNILMTADPEIPVPPSHYGGIERVAHLLISGLSRRGHKVHLFANPASRIDGTLIPYKGLKSGSFRDTFRNMAAITDYARNNSIDMIHSFGRVAYLMALLVSSIPKIQSYQRHISRRSIALARVLAGRSLHFACCSRSCIVESGLDPTGWNVIPNGVPVESYDYKEPGADAPLVFLGRVERIKGAHTAIRVAKRAGKILIIAGNAASSGPERDYFLNEISPHCDGKHIQFVGPVDDTQKNELLGKAAALLFPIEWSEPFGIVMAEALACGTPVIAFRRGSVPEVVDHGKTGYICDTEDQMTEYVSRIGDLSRADCRRAAHSKFSGDTITQLYEALYFSSLNQ